LLTIFLWLVVSSHVSPPQGPSQWDGVFTLEQASRGQAVYELTCQRCHGGALEGEGRAPALTGDAFTTAWNGRAVAEFFERIKTTMPSTSPGRLSPQETADVIAYIFRSGSYPAGQSELPAAVGALQSMRFIASKP